MTEKVCIGPISIKSVGFKNFLACLHAPFTFRVLKHTLEGEVRDNPVLEIPCYSISFTKIFKPLSFNSNITQKS